MWTIDYKGFYIHGYCNMPECRITHVNLTGTFKSLHAAKCAVTKYINSMPKN